MPDSVVPSTLGSYRLFDEIGRDPLGVLHLACAAGVRGAPRWAVVRRMHAGVARDPVMVHSFIAATQAAVRMVHRNVGATFDFGGKMTLPWSAREYILGARVVQLITCLEAQKTRMPWVLAGHIVAEAAEGVAALRARLPSYGPPMGFLAGAVAPNVFVSKAGEVKIVDGCLPLIDGAPLIDSRALPYRPREPVVGANAGPSDAFGLGVILWELIAGRRLFAGENDDETARLLDAKVVPSLRAIAKTPPVVDEIVQRALGKLEGDARPLTSAAEVASELRGALVANGKRAGAEDVARMMVEVFAGPLGEQESRLARAWAKEKELQASGVILPSEDSSETDLTIPIGQTVRDATAETAVSNRVASRREGFDEIPTIPRNAWGTDTPSWRTGSQANPLTRIPTPRIGFVEGQGTQRSASSPGVEAPESPRPFALLAQKRPPPPLVLPPVERGAAFPPPPPLPLPAPLAVTPVSRGRRPRSVLVAGALGFGVALLGIVVFGVYQPASDAELVPTTAPSPSVSAAVVSRPATRSTAQWTTLPTSPIPTASTDELPRAAGRPPGRAPSPAPPPPAGHLGLLTVFCTPACDEVYDGARALGPSPVFKVPAAAGVHRLRLKVDSLSREKTVTVRVAENDTTVVRENVGD